MGRKVQLMAESDLNDPRLIRPPEHGGYGLDAQWADDVHHTIHATLTGERHGYYQDFAGIATIADVLPRAVLLRAAVLAAPRPHARPLVGRRAAPAVRRLRAEPRPGGQPRRSASGSRRSSPRTGSGSRRRWCCCRPTCRCCSWARSTARRRPSSTSSSTAIPSWSRRCARDGGGSSRRSGCGRGADRSAGGGDVRARRSSTGTAASRPGRAHARALHATCSRCGERSRRSGRERAWCTSRARPTGARRSASMPLQGDIFDAGARAANALVRVQPHRTAAGRARAVGGAMAHGGCGSRPTSRRTAARGSRRRSCRASEQAAVDGRAEAAARRVAAGRAARAHGAARAVERGRVRARLRGRELRVTLRIWPGRPYPLGATWDGTGVNFALFSENATGVELCLFRRRRTTRGSAATIQLARAHRPGLALLPPRRPAGPVLRLPRARPVRAGARAPLQPGEAADRPVRQGDHGRDQVEQRRCSRTRSAAPREDLEPDRRQLGGRRAEVGGDRLRVHVGGRPAARACRTTARSSTSAT